MSLFGYTEDYMEDFLSLDQLLVKNRESTFFLRASGNSMAPLIHPDDVLVVDRSVKPLSGTIVVVTLDGERLCKRLSLKNGKTLLCSENSEYKPIEIGDDQNLVIFGKVVGIARTMK